MKLFPLVIQGKKSFIFLVPGNYCSIIGLSDFPLKSQQNKYAMKHSGSNVVNKIQRNKEIEIENDDCIIFVTN